MTMFQIFDDLDLNISSYLNECNEKNFSKWVYLVPNFTHFEILFQSAYFFFLNALPHAYTFSMVNAYTHVLRHNLCHTSRSPTINGLFE